MAVPMACQLQSSACKVPCLTWSWWTAQPSPAQLSEEHYLPTNCRPRLSHWTQIAPGVIGGDDGNYMYWLWTCCAHQTHIRSNSSTTSFTAFDKLPSRRTLHWTSCSQPGASMEFFCHISGGWFQDWLELHKDVPEVQRAPHAAERLQGYHWPGLPIESCSFPTLARLVAYCLVA
ncbi:hypothetical protein B0T22DRAFT_155896 [Podospora appendiculata]|uniref:Uncharacterized protein n=1 Tax=Podospora appendiculata TaxID=314037 RepID=A0AAE0X9F2_9PEZI|nr:hypothetical protein B0T22DRAFT_155896 [Podospora appendiculata]